MRDAKVSGGHFLRNIAKRSITSSDKHVAVSMLAICMEYVGPRCKAKECEDVANVWG